MLFISLFSVFAANFGKLIINLQRYYKKCTYASKRVIILQKDRLIYLIYPSAAIGSLLTDGCRWEYDRVLTIFENNYESLEYGLHDADVLSGECATAQAASEGTTKNTTPQGKGPANCQLLTVNYQSRVLDGFILYLH